MTGGGRSGALACALLAVAGAIAGCSPDLPKLDDPARTRVPGAPCPTAPKSSPKEPVLRMWCRLERRDLKGAAATYDPRARRALGDALPSTLEALGERRVYGRAEILDVEEFTHRDPVVIVRVGPPGRKQRVGWYRVHRNGSGWAITWDSTLRFSFFAYLEPDKVPFAVPRPRVKRDVLMAAVRRYDALFLETPR